MDGDIDKLDRLTLKSLASDAKIGILRRLAERRKTPSELSKEISAAPSTIVQHLKELEASGLVRRRDTRHKWIYYELTDKGANLFRPKIPFQLILSLALAIMITGIGAWNFLFSPQYDIGSINSAVPEAMKEATATGAYAAESSRSAAPLLTDAQLLFGIIAAAGLIASIALLYTVYRMTKRR